MHAIFWLAAKELTVRKVSILIGLLMCSLIISMLITVEWSLRSRESRVRQDIDQMGPPLIIVPSGKSATDLLRFDLGPRYFHEGTVIGPLLDGLRPYVRAVDLRLSTRLPVQGRDLPVIGIDPKQVISPHEALRQLKPNSAAVGKEIAAQLKLRPGDAIDIAGTVFNVETTLSSAADITDTAVFIGISQLRRLSEMSGGINEIRIYPKSSQDLDQIRKQLDLYGNALSSIVIDRGEVAENIISKSLARNRHGVYLLLGMILSISMMVWTYLDAKERRVELATVAAIGGSPATLVGLLSARSAIVGVFGALLGIGISFTIKSLTEGAFPGDLMDMSALMAATVLGAAFFSVAGSIPVAANLSSRNHAVLLQN